METINCEFYNPYYFDLATKTLLPFDSTNGGTSWNYKNYSCTSTDSKVALIQNSETGAEFFVDKTLNYGDSIIIWFLTAFAFYLIFRTAYNFFWKK